MEKRPGVTVVRPSSRIIPSFLFRWVEYEVILDYGTTYPVSPSSIHARRAKYILTKDVLGPMVQKDDYGTTSMVTGFETKSYGAIVVYAKYMIVPTGR